MSLYEIDGEATQRRIDAVTSGGLRSLGDLRQRAAEIDKSVAEMFERQEHARQALDEQVKAAAEKGGAQADEQPEPEARPKPKRTLSLGTDEFAETRAARPEPEQPRPAAPPQPPPEPDAEPVKPNRTLRLGAPEDRADEDRTSQDGPVPEPGASDRAAKGPDKTARRRPADGDDDQSGRTWLR